MLTESKKSDMAGDARDLPLTMIDSKSEFVVFSNHLGRVAEEATATDAVRKLLAHLKKFPGSDAALYKRSPDAWRVF
jgi:hypothetical protein